MAYTTETQKIDKKAIDGLSGTAGSLGYKVDEFINHHHGTGKWYGFATNNLSEGALTSFQVTAGNAARGTELLCYTGTGLSGVYFDFNAMKITAVGNINRLTFLEFYSVVKGAPVVGAATKADEKITKAAHGLSVNDRVMITDAGTTTGIDLYTVYFVGTKDTDWFTLSTTTANGAPVALDGVDGNVSYCPVTRTLMTEMYVNRTSATPDTFTIPIMSPRVLCTSSVSCVGKAAAGTNTVDMLFGIHTYTA
jgi:hypothetical protein